MQVPLVHDTTQPSFPVKPPPSNTQPVSDGQQEALSRSQDRALVHTSSSPGVGKISLFEDPPPLDQRIEETVQRVWEYSGDSGQQSHYLEKFKRELNQIRHDTLQPEFVYPEEDLTDAMQKLQTRTDKIQLQLDDGTPDCGGGMGEELDACTKTLQAMQEALQLRYL